MGVITRDVKSIAKSGSTKLKGDVTLSEGTGATLTQVGQNIEIAASGTGAPTDATYVTLSTNGTLSAERVLTGTANRITVTDNGAGSTVVLSTPQNIATTSVVQFGGLGIGSGAGSGSMIYVSGGTIAADKPILDAVQTWNNAGVNFAALKVDITDTDSLAASRLMDLKVGSVSKFQVLKNGTVNAGIWGGTSIATTFTDAKVVSVSGTADRITASGTNPAAIDIAATYAGQTSLITLGTVTTGTWSAGTIAVNKGGTGQTSYTNGQLLIGNTTGNTLAKATLTGTANQVVVTNGAGSITLSTPQDIATGSTVQFGSAGFGVANSSGRLDIKQVNNTVDGGITLEDSTGATATKFWRRGGAGTASTITDRGTDTINFSAGLVGIGLIDPADRLVVRGSLANVGTEWGNNASNEGVLQVYDRVGSAYRPLYIGVTVMKPNDNKTADLGATGARWNNIYYASATTGTSRLAPTNETCDHCLALNKTNKMVRGTGTTIYLGETADYMTVWCEECGHSKRMALNHLPIEKLAERKPAPQIIFEGLEIKQYSGRSRGVQVKFRYKDAVYEDIIKDDGTIVKSLTPKEQGIRNSTYLSDVEYSNFKLMTEVERQEFIKQLGQREWDAMEEVRLMKECCDAEQAECDLLVSKFGGKDLLIA